MTCTKPYGFDVVDNPLRRQILIEANHPNEPVFDETTRWRGYKTPFVICDMATAKEQADMLAAQGKCVHTWHNGDMVYHSYSNGTKGEGWPK